MQRAGGFGKFHVVIVYLGIGTGINSIIAWIYLCIPFLIQR